MKFDERLADAFYNTGADDERERIRQLADNYEALRACLECGATTEADRAPCCPESFWFADLLRTGTIPNKPAGDAMTPELAAAEAAAELRDAMAKFGPMASAHEGYAVILEELDELWDEIKSKTGTKQTQYDEAKQVAAMALRFMIDVCPPAAIPERQGDR